MSGSKRDIAVRFGRFVALPASNKLLDGGKPVPIEGKPFELLLALLERPGEVVPRQALYAGLWPDVTADYRQGLDTAVRKLRRALGDSPRQPRYIETLPRLGYRLMVPIAAVDVRELFANGHTPPPAETPASQEAHRLYLEGYHYMDKRTAMAQEDALKCFLRARECEPSNAACHAAVAHAWIMLASHGVRRPVEAVAEARSAALAALQINASNQFARGVLGYARGMFDYELAGALTDLRAAAQIIPESPWEYIPLSFVAAALGRGDEAITLLRRALANDPMSSTIHALQGYGMYLAGRLAEAVPLGRESVTRDPEFGLGRWYFGQELMAVGSFDEAIRELATAAWLMKDSPEVRATLGLALALSGRTADAGRVDGLLETTATRRYVDAYHRALLKDALGMRDIAVALLQQAANDHSHWFALARVDPKLERLRKDSRVEELLRQLRTEKTPA